MKMRYAWLAICMWAVLWGQETPKNQHSPSSTANNHASDPAQIVPPPSTAVKPLIAAPQSQPSAANAQQQTQTDPTIWFLRPEWVIVWVTFVYTVLTWRTLRAIKRQADLMAEQLIDARNNSTDSAKATTDTFNALQRQANAMDNQLEEMKRQANLLDRQAVLQFRPRLIVRTVILAKEMQISFIVTNVGGTNAQVITCYASVMARNKTTGVRDLLEGNKIPFAPGQVRKFTIPVTPELKEEIEDLNTTFRSTGTVKTLPGVYCVGHIRYVDDIGIERDTGFERIYRPRHRRFMAQKYVEGEYAD